MAANNNNNAYMQNVMTIGKETFYDLKESHPIYRTSASWIQATSIRQSIEAMASSVNEDTCTTFRGIKASIGDEMAYAWAYASIPASKGGGGVHFK